MLIRSGWTAGLPDPGRTDDAGRPRVRESTDRARRWRTAEPLIRWTFGDAGGLAERLDGAGDGSGVETDAAAAGVQVALAHDAEEELFERRGRVVDAQEARLVPVEHAADFLEGGRAAGRARGTG